MLFNPKKLKKSELKIFSFINSYLNIIDYLILIINILLTTLLIIFGNQIIVISILTTSYFFSFLFVLKFNSKRIIIIFWYFFYYNISTEKRKIKLNESVFYKEKYLLLNDKYYLAIIFKIDYDTSNKTNDSHKKHNQFENFFYFNDSNFFIINSSDFIFDIYSNIHFDQLKNKKTFQSFYFFESPTIEKLQIIVNQINNNFNSSEYMILNSNIAKKILEQHLIIINGEVEINPKNVKLNDNDFFLQSVLFKKESLDSEIKNFLKQKSIIFFRKIPNELILKRLKSDLSLLKISVSYSQEIIKDYENLIKKIEQEDDLIFEISILLFRKNDDKIKSKFLKINKNFYKQDYILNQLNSLSFTLDNYLTFSNFKLIQDFSSTSILDDTSGALIGFNSKNYPILIDPFYKNEFDRINNNHLIMGMSGSGKTYLMKLFLKIVDLREQNYLVIDSENEYFENKINQQKISFNLLFIFNSFLYFDDLTDISYLSLISEIWMIFDYKSEVDLIVEFFHYHFHVKKYITKQDIINLFEKNKIQIQSSLRPFLFNKEVLEENNFMNGDQKFSTNFSNKIILDIRDFFNLSKFSSKSGLIFDKSLIFTLELILDCFVKSSKKFAIFFDEFHLFLNSENKLIMYISQLVKQIRKRDGVLFLSTQNLIDFKNHERFIIQTIMNNCNYHYFSKMILTDIEEFKNLTKNSWFISQQTVSMIESFSRGEFLLVIQNRRYDVIKTI